ncbi:nitrate/nitrite transporter NrtS [Myxacorys almedinensis]|uniref:Uncharacterized protein n=1 Tax=Myxacorys almedinensis A TaxID=2690445 RepID=A0A8J8CJR0_9CYAN|nr:nitrate/nitrite transporter NrtS [Myxacorys almedinensis]NDJ15785.1 hypothetical protein [Myxacorys almedinensis A]
MMQFLKGFLASLTNPRFAPTAFKVALVIGTLLLVLNHGRALIDGQMSRDRWISAMLTYCVPYFVSIHGQYTSAAQRSRR